MAGYSVLASQVAVGADGSVTDIACEQYVALVIEPIGLVGRAKKDFGRFLVRMEFAAVLKVDLVRILVRERVRCCGTGVNGRVLGMRPTV